MADLPVDPFGSLEAGLRRFQQAAAQLERRDAELLETFARQSAGLSYWEQRRVLRRLRRDLRRRGPLSWFPGFITGAWALGFAALAATHPGTHGFLGWVALGFGVMSAQLVRRALRGRHEEKPPPEGASQEVADPRIAKVDALCDKLLAELRGGSRVLQEVVHQPEQVVQGLRGASHEIVRRERALRRAVTPEDDARLAAERSSLAARIAAENDPVVRQRLGEALSVLDRQIQQRAELSTAANRLEAEHTRLYYTLEALYTDVLRVRSAEADAGEAAGAGLKQNLARLGEELDAVAASLEAVSREGARLEPIAPVAAPDSQDTGRRPEEREREAPFSSRPHG